MDKAKKYQAHVRFSDKEREKILYEARELRFSVPELLKSTYFRKGPLRILMRREDTDQVIQLLVKACGSLNHIRQGITAGLVNGTEDDLSGIGRALTGIMAIMNANAFRKR